MLTSIFWCLATNTLFVTDDCSLGKRVLKRYTVPGKSVFLNLHVIVAIGADGQQHLRRWGRFPEGRGCHHPIRA